MNILFKLQGFTSCRSKDIYLHFQKKQGRTLWSSTSTISYPLRRNQYISVKI